MIGELILNLGVWNWFILGLILLGIELAFPGAVFIWLGVAALLTGAIALTGTTTWQVDIVIFAALSVVLLLLGRKYFRRGPDVGRTENLNKRGSEYIGNTYELAEDMKNGNGRLYIGDTFWRIRGETAKAGTRIRVIGTSGPVLLVEPAL